MHSLFTRIWCHPKCDGFGYLVQGFAMRRLVRFCFPLLLFLPLTGCPGDAGDGFAGREEDVAEQDRYGGTGVIGAISDIPDVNPLTATETVAREIQQFMLFVPVLHYDENFEPVPAHARSWEVSPDTTLLTFHLRDDLHWHDGVKVTAADLKLAYDLARVPDTGFPNTAFWTHYGEAEAPDSFTFHIRMRPHAEFLDPWRRFYAVPGHILGDVPPAQLRAHPFSHREPVGNGPFRFVNRVEGQSWTFEANPDFPPELGGRPYLDRIVYRNIPEPTTLLTELLTGRIDFYAAMLPAQADQVERSRNTRLIYYPDRSYVLIGWNQRRQPFNDLRVRRALTVGMNRERITDAVLHGYGQKANSPVPPFFWQYDPEAGADLTYDPEEAQRLLAEAGWTPGPDGILRNAQGEPFRFTLITNQGNQVRADIAEIVQADLRRIGVDMRIQIQEWGTMLSRINTPDRRDFDAVLIGWRTEFRADDTNLFHCDERDGPYQWVGHCNPELDRLLEQLMLMPDREQARPYWQQYQRLIAQDQPFTFVYFQERLHGVGNRLRNVNPDPRGDWVGADRWWILPQQRGARPPGAQ
jgi:peptide/nickel transport system substrate-binding protein